MTATVMTRRELNRALLARQRLLLREPASALTLVEQLVGLQAQQARPPFIGLWSRIDGFERAELQQLIESRQIVRATLMRATLHLMSASDYRAFRPALQPALSLAMQSALRERAAELRVNAVVAAARALYATQPRTFTEVRSALQEAFPTVDERVLGYAVRTHLPLVVVPDRSDWRFSSDPAFTVAEDWLGAPLASDDQTASLVLRYLAAFGPATASDIQAWSGLTGLKAVLESLRPRLCLFRDERKRELFDLPEAPRPPAATPAPVRLLADFDNLILAHADRTRIIADEHRSRVVTRNLLVLPTFLVDGFVAGTWKATRVKKTAILAFSPFEPLAAAVKASLEAEAEGLMRLLEPEAEQLAVQW